MRPSSLLLLLLLGVDEVCSGRVKNAIFGSMFSGSSDSDINIHTDADQVELIEFLRANGFGKYASKTYIAKLDDELAYDSIEDLTHLVADDEYSEIGMDHDDALEIQMAARREMLKRFLEKVPLPEGKPTDFYLKHLDGLIKAGYDEPDDVADLEADEAQTIGLEAEHLKPLVGYADEYETRELLHIILVTLVDSDGTMPYTTEEKWRPIIDALLKAGVRKLEDVAAKTEVPGLSAVDLTRLHNDRRVLQHAQKDEI